MNERGQNRSTMPIVLITDGENRSALAATRSLGRKGCRVVVTSKERLGIAAHSKFCCKRYLTPDPSFEGDAYLDTIMNVVDMESIDVIFPMTEISIYLLNKVRSRLSNKVILACPPTQTMEAVSNKVDLFKLAESLQIPIPRTIYITNNSLLEKNLDRIGSYPVVVKPALSKIQGENGEFLSGGVRYAQSADELRRIYRTSPVLRYPSMIQEKILGPGTGLFTLFDGQKHLALFSHRRLKEKPPSGGVSVISESVPLDEQMVASANQLLSAVSFRGVAMVEFKRDVRDGKAKLMEINGRFWGTLQLAIASGIDFPVLYLDYIKGYSPPSVIRGYRQGQKLKWLFGAIDHLWIYLKSSKSRLNLPQGYPSKLQEIYNFIKVWDKNTCFDVLDMHDIGPFMVETRSYFKR
jgi:predicted ATP-grasp superfamily ATP-dependent carboligase